MTAVHINLGFEPGFNKSGFMRPVIDDLSEISAARLRALGDIGRDTKTATVRFDDSGVEFVVGVTSMRLQHGGDWSMFRCSCGRRARILRLFDGRPACGRCIRATGMRYRIEMVSHASKRVALTAPKRIERLSNADRTGIKRRMVLPRRANMEAKLRRSLIVARQFAIDEHDEMLNDK
jgi:hypothetical protein